MKLRKLNELGLKNLREFLAEAREGGSRPPSVPEMLLTLPVTSEAIEGAPELDLLPSQTSGYELARYLRGEFNKIDPAAVEGTDGLGDPGFWAAVALFYFYLLTPGYRSGQGKPKADNCYIPETGTTMTGVRYFRHRIAGAYRLHKLHENLSEPLLLSPASEQSVLYTRITDSVFYTETHCVVEAVNLLYFDARHHRLKRGWNAKDKPGTLSRLLAVVDQFDLTYDLLGISGETLLEQLPVEFDDWRPSSRN